MVLEPTHREVLLGVTMASTPQSGKLNRPIMPFFYNIQDPSIGTPSSMSTIAIALLKNFFFALFLSPLEHVALSHCALPSLCWGAHQGVFLYTRRWLIVRHLGEVVDELLFCLFLNPLTLFPQTTYFLNTSLPSKHFITLNLFLPFCVSKTSQWLQEELLMKKKKIKIMF